MKIFLISIVIILGLVFAANVFAIDKTDTTCWSVGWWTEHGDPLCAIACSDGEIYPMPCDAEIFD